jgi:hypothetical protein
MKVRYKENLVIFFDMFFGLILIVISSLGYFLGFPINKNTLLYYFITVISIFLIMISIYIIYRIVCKTYIFFNDEISINKNKSVILNVKYNKILSAKYCNILNLLIGYPEGGNLVIEYLDENNKKKELYIAIAKKKLKKINLNCYIY